MHTEYVPTNWETNILKVLYHLLRILFYPFLVVSNIFAAIFIAAPALYPLGLPFLALNIVWFLSWVFVSFLAYISRVTRLRRTVFVIAFPFLLIAIVSIVLMPTYVPKHSGIFSIDLSIKSIERLDYILSFPFCGISTPLRDKEIERRMLIINKTIAALLAKIAKSDGHVSKEEVDIARGLLLKFVSNDAEYKSCVAAFNNAINDNNDIAFYANKLVKLLTPEACLLVYEAIWSVASADGRLDPAEDKLLKQLAVFLGLSSADYDYFKNLFFKSSGAGPLKDTADELNKAYTLLGCTQADSCDTLRKAYHKQAMKYHPDRLRAEGLPDALIEQATKTMSDINNAWEIVRRNRGI